MGAYLEMVKPEEDLKLRSFLDEGHVFVNPHWHKEVEIIYVKKGNVNIGVNDRPIRLQEGEIYIINGGEVHYFFASPDSERSVLIFDAALFQDVSFMNRNGRSLKSQISKIVNSSHEWDNDLSNQVKKIIDEINSECSQKDDGYVYALKAKMFELITLIYRKIPLKSEADIVVSKLTYTEQSEILDKLDLVFDYIEEHYKDTISLEEVAEYIGFSHFYFTKFFKKNTGMTFVTFLNYYRLNKAKWMLTHTNVPISEVAYEAGFQSVKTFYRLFKQEANMSPLQYQKQYFRLLEEK
ncbi:MAG: helix-turn-helix domain-containing protein [Turicibacter sp.]